MGGGRGMFAAVAAAPPSHAAAPERAMRGLVRVALML
jgi:hypothetical protein